jgi:septum site-determining protein MinD
MAGTVLTVAGGKGGVGKTTTVINTGIALQQAGLDVCLVDADIGMGNLSPRLGIDHDPSLHDVLAGEAPLVDALADAPADLTVLAGVVEDIESIRAAEPAGLGPVLRNLRTRHDVVLVDTGAGLSHASLVAAGSADGLLLVTTPDDLSAIDTRKTGELAGHVDATLLGAVVTRAGLLVDTDDLEDTLGTAVLATVGEDMATVGGEPALRSDPDSHVADAYRNLADAIVDELALELPEPVASD